MASIFISMSGEGRGHATRMRAIADELRAQHRITIFAPGDAHEIIEPAFRGSDIPVHEIPCLRFFYTPNGRLDTGRTVAGNAKYILGFRGLLRTLRMHIQQGKPDLIITDFEPALPRAARQCGVPYISLNHQHFLVVNDLSGLPAQLRRHAFLMSLVVRRYYSKQARTIVSSFYFPPIKPQYRDRVVQVGVILRPAVVATPRADEGHLVAYLRKFALPNVLDALRGCGRPVRLYGLGAKATDGNIEYREISEAGFLRDLGTCSALVTTAGNQLVGEALYLGKPVLAMPEPNNQEQYINAHFLREEGTGDWIDLDRLTPATLRGFTEKLDEYRSHIVPDKFNGNPLAIKTIEDFLSSIAEGRASK